MPSDDCRKILIVAAEASSCLYAQRLLQHWKSRNIPVQAFGIGNQSMADEGFECLGRAEELAVVGVQEVVAHWPVIKKAFYALIDAVRTRAPQVVLLLDYPDFNLRLAKKLKAMGVPVVYYISPQVWAWRTGRVNLIRSVIDRLLVVFPFEVDFYRGHGVQVQFVGHPLLDELRPDFFAPEARRLRRARFGIGEGELVLALMPGSRNSELNHHLETQLAVASALRARHRDLRVALLVAPNFTKEQIQDRLSALEFPLMLIQDEPFAMIDLADAVLCASGTATLMVGLLEKPMVIMYRMNALSAWLAKMFVKSTRHFGLINLVLNDRVAPEFFQEQANVDTLVRALEPLVVSADARSEMSAKLRPAKDRLGRSGATVRVAEALETYWNRST